MTAGLTSRVSPVNELPKQIIVGHRLVHISSASHGVADVAGSGKTNRGETIAHFASPPRRIRRVRAMIRGRKGWLRPREILMGRHRGRRSKGINDTEVAAVLSQGRHMPGREIAK